MKRDDKKLLVLKLRLEGTMVKGYAGVSSGPHGGLSSYEGSAGAIFRSRIIGVLSVLRSYQAQTPRIPRFFSSVVNGKTAFKLMLRGS